MPSCTLYVLIAFLWLEVFSTFNFRCVDIRELLGSEMGYVRAGHLHLRKTVSPFHHHGNWSLPTLQRWVLNLKNVSYLTFQRIRARCWALIDHGQRTLGNRLYRFWAVWAIWALMALNCTLALEHLDTHVVSQIIFFFTTLHRNSLCGLVTDLLSIWPLSSPCSLW